MNEVVLLVPAGIDDPAHPSGGNRYDRSLAAALPGAGWRVGIVPVRSADGGALGVALAGVPAGAVLLADGLVLASAPRDAVRLAPRLRLVPLLHMAPPPDSAGQWRALLTAARAVITTSEWTRRQVLDALPAGAAPPITVAPPGVEAVLPVAPSATGVRLRCVAALLPHKGQDVLLAALATISDLDWRCDLVGATDLDPGFTARLRQEAAAYGITDRIRFLGARGSGLRELYDGADLLVVPSRTESYGMVITEAVACGLPVIAADTGGVRQALGSVDGRLPGLLVAPGSAAELAAALRAWLSRPRLRAALTARARLRRGELHDWAATARTVAAALAGALDEPEAPAIRRSG